MLSSILMGVCMGLLPIMLCNVDKDRPEASRVVRSEDPMLQARFDYVYFEALAREQAGKHDEAFELFRRASEIDSTSAPALFSLSSYYSKMNRPDRALGLIQKCVRLDSLNIWYGSSEAQLYLQLKQPEMAMACYERMAKLSPDNEEIWYALADLYINADSAQQSLRVLNKIEELDGLNPQITAQKFYIYQQLGEPEKAFAEYETLIDKYPYNISYRIRLGEMQMKFGRIADAKNTYDEAATIEPDNAYLWLAQANYYTITGNREAADTLVKAALLNAKLDIETKIDILTDYLKTNLRKVAQEKAQAADTTAVNLPGVDSLFATVASMHPTSPEVYELEAEYLAAVGRDSLARERMHYAIDLKPSDAAYWNRYLSMQMQAGHVMQIRQTAQEALQYHPGLYMAFAAQAYACQLQEDYAGTLAAYQEALKHLEPTDVSQISKIWGYMGDLYHQLNQIDKTYEAYDMALKYNDQNISVLNNYSYFLSLEKRELDKAERMCSVVIKLSPDEPTYLDTYAWIFFQQGNYSLAKFYQERAIQHSGKQPSAALIEHYGDILMMMGDKERALEQWKQAVALPDCESTTLTEKIKTETYIEEVPAWLKKSKK